MTPLAPYLLAAALPENATLGDSAQFALVGFVVVLTSLTLISLLCAAVGAVFQSAARRGAAAAASSAPGDELPTETLAVLAAAVAVAIDKPHRIVHIRGLSAADLEWSMEGRMLHHTSHNPRRQS